MLIVSRRALKSGLPLLSLALLPTARLHAQAEVETPLRRQLHRLELSLSAIDNITGTTSGVSYANDNPRPAEAQTLQSAPTTAIGGLLTIRYTRSPLVGGEFNYSYNKYTFNYTPQIVQGGVQNSVNEFSVGYVAHGPRLTGFGIQPFGSVGVGTTAFKPTTFGGQGLREQARMTYYYAVGADVPVLLEGRLGFRAQLRQAFFLSPDWGQNYLTIKQHTSSLQPAIGLYLHF